MSTGREPGGRAPDVAALLSLLFPGLGQAWLGALRRGLLLALPAVAVISSVAVALAIDAPATLRAVVQPSALLAGLVAIVALGIWHAVAISDAFRLASRRGSAPRSALRSPLPLVALVAVLTAYGTVEVVGIRAWQTAEAVFVKPDTGFAIPEPSFEVTPRPRPSGSLPPPTAAPSPTPEPTPGPAWAADGRLNLLLMGSDAGPGRWLARTDTMIVLSVDVATGRAALFSVPRNIVNVPLPPESAGAFPDGRYPALLNSLYVYAVGHPSQFPGGEARGFRAVTGAIQELVGVPLDGAIVVNLNGFVDLVDAVDGLWIEIPRSLYDPHYPKPDGTGSIEIYFAAGCRHLDGIRALEYARSRHQDSDYGRIRRQQAVLVALARELDPIGLLPRVPELLDIAQDNLWTTIEPTDIVNLAVLAAKVDTHTIRTISLEPPTYPEFLTTAAIKRVRTLVREIFDAPPPDASPTPGPTASPRPCPRD